MFSIFSESVVQTANMMTILELKNKRTKLSKFFSFCVKSYLIPVRISPDKISLKLLSKNILLHVTIYYILTRIVLKPFFY